MRSIGVKNINLVKKTTRQVIASRTDWSGQVDNYVGVEDEVVEKLPVELWDTWEMADQQIRSIINDTIRE